MERKVSALSCAMMLLPWNHFSQLGIWAQRHVRRGTGSGAD
jgi:hypothetical protein